MTSPVVRVGIADDDAFVRQALSALLTPAMGLEIQWAVADGAQALAAATEAASPIDVLLLDMQMPVLDGLATLVEMRAQVPTLPVVMLTTFDAGEQIMAALERGARGYFVKDDDPALIAAGLRSVVSGGFAFSPTASAAVVSGFLASGFPQTASAPVPTPTTTRPPTTSAPAIAEPTRGPGGALLTERETAVLVLITQSLSNKQIAQRLNVSDATVKSHVSTIISKLGVADRVGAAVWAYRNGLA